MAAACAKAQTIANKRTIPMAASHSERRLELIERYLRDLMADGDERVPSQVIANRLNTGEDRIIREVCTLAVRRSAEARALKMAIKNALSLASQAGRELYEEVA